MIKEWIDRVLNSKSKSFCGAKWNNATIWLGSGGSASCHHPPPHRIDKEEIKDNPSAIHNTKYKKRIRKQMQDGVRPRECEYCWKIEDLGPEYISDRYRKSFFDTEEKLDEVFNTPWNNNVTPTYLEISFDSNCNFACSYCNASFSTIWSKDINTHGPYQNLISDGGGAYTHNGNWAQPYGPENKNNPYVEAFWKWWETDLQYSLRELRVTGGEATVSPTFWKLVQWFKNNPKCKVKLTVNSNLGSKEFTEKLINLQTIQIYTSAECINDHAEYIRDGLNYNQWISNVKYCLENNITVQVMMTLNALCFASLDKFQEQIIELRDQFPELISMTYNILRFPSFQSITTLPEHIKKQLVDRYIKWTNNYKKYLQPGEIEGMDRTIKYISDVSQSHSIHLHGSDLESKQKDFKSFYTQYDTRRNKNFFDTFKDWPELIDWYETLTPANRVVNKLTVGDANDWGKPIYDEVMKNE